MVIPVAALEIDFARPTDRVKDVPSRFRRARILARWAGVPVGIVEVSVRDGQVHATDVLSAVQRESPHALPAEAVRRALLATGIGTGVDLAALWQPVEPARPAAQPVSVVICTRDRTADLAECLASLRALDPAPTEVVVVDNAPATDATRRLVLERFPEVRYVHEPRPGLDHARNRGIAETSGPIIAFTDDDVVVDPDWIGAIGRAFAADPEVALVTGLAEPAELESRAQLLFERYGGFGRGCRRNYLQAPRWGGFPWTLVGAGQLAAGANMAFRREVLQRVGGFDPALDVGTPALGGGDHDMFFRVLHARYLCVYDPSAVVRHRHRRTLRELRRLLYCYGHATRCFLDREELNFPADRSAIRQLRRWWWRHWAWARMLRSALRPGWLPTQLVWAEIAGYRDARGAYARTRAAIVPDETHRPDPVPVPEGGAPSRPAGAIGIVTVDVAAPLQHPITPEGCEQVELVVTWRGRPLGTHRIAHGGRPLSPRRLADEIARALWHRLLEPTGSESAAFVRFGLAFSARVVAPASAGPASESPAATVVLATCNRPAELRRCLESLQTLRVARRVQIVVVDNRPASGTAAAVVQDFPGVELVTESRPGSSYARNAGVAAARGELVAMVDDDMRVAPDWLEQLLAPFARRDVMVVTGNTLAASLDTHAERMLDAYGGFCRGFERREFNSTWFDRWRRAVPTWQIGGSGNMAFRREIFSWRAVGRFDERLGAGVPTGVGEDTKFFYDVLAAGYTILYEPGAVAWHYHRVTLPALRQQLYAYSKGHVAYHLITFLEHGDWRAWVRLLVELPMAYLHRAWLRWRHRTAYPWSLLLVEFAGTLAGPWSLWEATRLARRHARNRAGRHLRAATPTLPVLQRKDSALPCP